MENATTDRRPADASRYLFLMAAVFAGSSVGLGIYRALTSSNDLLTRYEEWDRLLILLPRIHGWPLPYLPIFYLAMTPLFLLGFTAAKTIWCGINLVCGWYVWRRTCDLMELDARQRCWALVCFGAWASLRVTIGSGQVGLVYLAAILAALPFATTRHSLLMAVGLIKHTLVFPIYLRQSTRRPAMLLIPLVAAVAPLVLLWALSGIDLASYLHFSRVAAGSMLTEWEGGTFIGSFLKPFFASQLVMYGLIWAAWGLLYFILVRRLRDEMFLLAALLLMSLWPIYHRPYDLVVALPTLALFLKHGRYGWAVGMTVYMLGWYDYFIGERVISSDPTLFILNLFYPMLILSLICALVILGRDRAIHRSEQV